VFLCATVLVSTILIMTLLLLVAAALPLPVPIHAAFNQAGNVLIADVSPHASTSINCFLRWQRALIHPAVSVSCSLSFNVRAFSSCPIAAIQ
jgi:hypothetical protein